MTVLAPVEIQEQADACFRRAIQTPGARNSAEAKRDLEEALLRYQQLCAYDPQNPVLFYNQGLIYQYLDRLEDSLASYKHSLAIRPDHPDTLNNCGGVLHRLNRFAEALQCYQRIFAQRIEHADAYNNATMALLALRRPLEALDSSNSALRLRPLNADTHNNLGLVLLELQRTQEAIDIFTRAIELDPKHHKAWFNRANALLELHRIPEAVADYDQVSKLLPEDPQAAWHKSLALLKAGLMQQAWPLYELRWQRDNFTSPKRGFTAPQWKGDFELHGKTILLHHEQGLGDGIQFMRYVPWVKAQGATRVIAEVPRTLLRLFSSMESVDEWVPWGEPLPRFDAHCPMMSLPLALRAQVPEIPAPIPYLHSQVSLREIWAKRLGPATCLRVGLVWSGSTVQKNDSRRSMPLADLLAHLPPGIEYHSLQKEIRETDRELLATSVIQDHHASIGDMADSAALCDLMDLVISVDTSLAHLAGALGKPVWILLGFLCDWRWQLHRTDSPWYPNAKLYRQSENRSWPETLQTLAQDLAHWGQVNPPDKLIQAQRHYIHANQCYAHGRITHALSGYDYAISLNPEFAYAYNNRGNSLLALNQAQAALESYDRALAIDPDFLDPLTNRGLALQKLGRKREVIQSLERVIARTPLDPEAHLNLGLMRLENRQTQLAKQCFTRAIACDPNHAESHWNLSIAHLLDGELEEGFAQYEWRKQKADVKANARIFHIPEWTGQFDLKGKTLFLHHEQGLGDSLQFVRYLRFVKEQGATLILEMPPPLIPLLQQFQFVDHWMGIGNPVPTPDCHCHMMSLAYALCHTVKSIPSPEAYLRSHPQLRVQWQERLGPAQAPRVGLAWSGSLGHKNDSKRSLPLAEWLPHLPPGLEYHALQKDIRPTDADVLAKGAIHHHSDNLHDFNQTAALCDLMDLVISVDTSVVHLAGALGKPTWLMLPFQSDWRWGLTGTTTPWYRSMRIYRQDKRREWGELLMRVGKSLQKEFKTTSGKAARR